jgi:hypothetical protein
VSSVRAAAVLAGLVAMAPAMTACRSSERTDDGPRPSASAASVATKPPELPADHLAPGELLEGTEQALGLTLPRGLHVDGRIGNEVFASGTLTVHPVVQYFQARLTGGDLREGAAASTFEDVRATGASGPPLMVRVAALQDTVRVVIRDTTPVPVLTLPDEAARWKHVGLTPSGRIADPTHLD